MEREKRERKVVLCSACLLGMKCRYDGRIKPNKKVRKLAKRVILIPVPRINLNPEPSVHTYGAACTTSDGKTGLYDTNGDCYTCSVGTAVTNPINNNCSNGIAGVYCCGTANGNNGGNGGSKCIPTGCGSLWRCSGSYYLGGQQIRVNGCFPVRMGDVYPDWTGTCRQCP